MKKSNILLAISLVALVAISCGVAVLSAETQPLSQSVAIERYSAQAPTKPLMATATPQVYIVVRNWNLRREPNTSEGIGILYDGTAVEVTGSGVINENKIAWLPVQTIEENQADVRYGWVNAKALEVKEK